MSTIPLSDSSFWTYYVDDDQAIRQHMEKVYAEAITVNQSFWSEADIDTRFRAGDQTLWNDLYGNLPAFRKRTFNFNRIQRVCNMISGYQRRNRKSTVVTPVENDNSKAASQHTKVMFYANRSSNALEALSESFDDTLTTGMNLLAVWMDWRNDPLNGDLKVDPLSYNQFIIDPYFRKKDLSDCNFVWIRRYYTKQQAVALLPGQADYIMSLSSDEYRDGKFQFTPESYQYGTRNLIPYDEFWYRDMRRSKLLVDVQTGETREWVGKQEDLDQFMALYPQISVVERDIPTVKLAITVRNRVCYHGANPMGIDRFPFVPVFAYYYPQLPYFPWRIQGVCRGLRDAQFLYNRRKVIELDIAESMPNSGFIFKENAPINPKDLFISGQGRHIALKQEAQMTDIIPIQPPNVPPSFLQMSELLGREVSEISGVNEELLGSAVDDKAGILSMLRQGAGLTTLQFLFDQLDQSQKLLGEVFMESIQANWSPGKIKKIVQEDPAPEFYHRTFAKYEVVIEEGMLSATARQLQFAQALELKQMGIPVPTSKLIEYSTLVDKEDLVEGIAREEQQASQMAQQKQQLEMAVLKAQMQDLESRAIANQGLGLERVSRVQENRALAIQRIAEAHRDEKQANLAMIKGMKEVQGIDLGHIKQALELIEMIKQQTEPALSEISGQAAPNTGVQESSV